MNILFTARAFDNIAGGVERMLTSLMNDMVTRGHTVHLLTLDREDGQSFYMMNPAIRWHKMAIGDYRRKASFSAKIQRIVKGRKIIKSIYPDLIVGFMDGAFLSAKIYSLGLGIPCILAERNAPQRFDIMMDKGFKSLYLQSFRLADAITVQCPSYVEKYPQSLRSKITVIPNPVIPAPSQADPAGIGKEIKTLLCVGRLSFQKNQIVLVEAFSLISSDFPDWRLVLVGEGEDRPKLEQLIARKNLQTRVILEGAKKNVGDYYTAAQLLCLPSLFEGFPNVLAEAMSYGLPAVGFRDCPGVCDLIEDGKTGWLAQGNGDLQSLASSLRAAMQTDNTRNDYGHAARMAMQNYAPAAIYDRWQNFLLDIGGQ